MYTLCNLVFIIILIMNFLLEFTDIACYIYIYSNILQVSVNILIRTLTDSGNPQIFYANLF